MSDVTHEFGKHYIIELIKCDPEKIKYVDYVQGVFLDAAEKSEATIVEHFFKQYEPYGVTGIILISESHFSIHTWPEEGYVAIDILTCGTMKPQNAIEVVKQGFQAGDIKQQTIIRGY